MTDAKKHVVVVGCGALGSHVAMLLRNEALLTLVDFDRVEAKNTLAQFFGKPSVGKNKAETLRQQLDFLWGVKATARPVKLTAENSTALLEAPDLIVDCVDNGDARRVMQEWCSRRKAYRPCLHAGLAADGAFARVAWDRDFLIDDAPAAGAPTCEGGEFLPFIAAVAGLVAQSVQTYLRDGKRYGWAVSPAGAQRI